MPSSIYRSLKLGDLESTGHLKYAYLEDDQKLPITIANNLQFEQEERKHRKVIGWSLADLLRINRSICMHRILLEN
ncbi:hypothetical protein CR513_01414, partial [Mucuna pruriens]